MLELTRMKTRETLINIGETCEGNHREGWWAILDSDQ